MKCLKDDTEFVACIGSYSDILCLKIYTVIVSIAS